MASPLATRFSNTTFFYPLLIISMAGVVFVSAYEFPVGGDRGWIMPTGNDTETYNEWATRNRFHVGDSVYFKYKKDSVLVVNYTDYRDCILSNPIFKFNDGNTVFRFDRYGYFYFISGEPDHCRSGQKMVIRVMVHPEVKPPRSAPPPGTGSGGAGGGSGGKGGGSGSFEWGPPSINSTVKLSVASYFMTALGGVMVILYFFM